MLSDEERARIYAEALKIQEDRSKLRSEVTYLDEFGQECSKEYAKKAIIREFNLEGDLVNETFADIGQNAEPDFEDEEEKKTKSM